VPITNPGCAPYVDIPQGTIFPDGVDTSPANPVIQATVRPAGSVFRTSPGYETVRRGSHKLQNPTRFGMHFAPVQLAEDISTGTALIDKADFTKNADVADLPQSDMLDADGKLSDDSARMNQGVKLADSSGAPVGLMAHPETRTIPDMGDRDPGRPLTVKHLEYYFRNPAGAFRSDYSQNPWMAILIAGGLTGLVYMVAKDFEGSYSRRNSGGTVGAVGAAPAAAVATAGKEVSKAADVANDAATAAGQAAKEAASAAGDAASAAGDAAEKVTEAAADAVKE
jgi:hypothetical protein